MKRTVQTLFAVVLIALSLTGCTGDRVAQTGAESPTQGVESTQEIITLFDTNTIRIELEGKETRVFDLAGNQEYSFTTKRIIRTEPLSLEKMQARALGRISADTDTIKITLSGGLIVVEDKTAHETYYIH